MPDRISRRTVLAAIPVAALAQAPPPAAQAPAAVAPAGDKLQKANADVKESSNRLAQIAVPMDLEPAVTFHV